MSFQVPLEIMANKTSCIAEFPINKGNEEGNKIMHTFYRQETEAWNKDYPNLP